jgi:D-alanyl-D-alanine carboxypeptidase/D-alanyl-D-alanine-endopeptidase (penicillin-binding protein 4)
MSLMRPTYILTAASAVLLMLCAPAAAAPPKPLPNPDRPAVTPILRDGATTSVNPVCPAMRKAVRSGNRGASLMVKNLGNGKRVCSSNPKAERSLASNTKLFTTVTALGRLGPGHTMLTKVFSDGKVGGNGVLRGSLYLRGDGDPSLGTGSFLDAYSGGAGSDIDRLAATVRKAGIKRVTGRLYGDATVFDRLRGVADSGYATSPYIGPLSGLSINAGYTNSSFSRFSSDPAKLAAITLVRRLRSKGVAIQKEIALRKTPPGHSRRLIARLPSPDMVWMSRMTNVNSNNFFAEMLLKHIGAEARKSGTTAAGAVVVKRYVKSKFGAVVKPVDGSGLTMGNRSTTGDIVKMLGRVRSKGYGKAFVDSLAVAGRSGTLADRMRGSAAAGKCHAKTGTLTGVSALSGYCFNGSGHKYAFSILMNGVYDTTSARAAQDRIAAIIARL